MQKSKTIFFLIVVGINILLAIFFDKGKNYVLEVIIIHIFLFSLSLLSDLIRKSMLSNKKWNPSYFLSIHFLRILLCIVFLLPIISSSHPDKMYLYNFFAAYFIYLFFDIYFASDIKKK